MLINSAETVKYMMNSSKNCILSAQFENILFEGENLKFKKKIFKYAYIAGLNSCFSLRHDFHSITISLRIQHTRKFPCYVPVWTIYTRRRLKKQKKADCYMACKTVLFENVVRYIQYLVMYVQHLVIYLKY